MVRHQIRYTGTYFAHKRGVSGLSKPTTTAKQSYWAKMYLQVLGSVNIIISFIVTHTCESNCAVLHNNFKLLLGNAVC